jgi:hypothetical protein
MNGSFCYVNKCLFIGTKRVRVGREPGLQRAQSLATLELAIAIVTLDKGS